MGTDGVVYGDPAIGSIAWIDHAADSCSGAKGSRSFRPADSRNQAARRTASCGSVCSPRRPTSSGLSTNTFQLLDWLDSVSHRLATSQQLIAIRCPEILLHAKLKGFQVNRLTMIREAARSAEKCRLTGTKSGPKSLPSPELLQTIQGDAAVQTRLSRGESSDDRNRSFPL